MTKDNGLALNKVRSLIVSLFEAYESALNPLESTGKHLHTIRDCWDIVADEAEA